MKLVWFEKSTALADDLPYEYPVGPLASRIPACTEPDGAVAKLPLSDAESEAMRACVFMCCQDGRVIEFSFTYILMSVRRGLTIWYEQ